MKGIGKNLLTGNFDLLKLSLPVAMFEPRSYLEKLADPWVFPYFLDRAAETPGDPELRMKWVITFLVAGFHLALSRFQKPFNPILGETWQASLLDGSRVYLEQVSHHPPISAFQLIGEGGKYLFEGQSEPSVAYKTNGIKTAAKGHRAVRFADGGVIEIQYPFYSIKGLLGGGAPRAEIGGKAVFTDAVNGLKAEVHFGKVEGAPAGSMLARSDAIQGKLMRMVTVGASGSDENSPVSSIGKPPSSQAQVLSSSWSGSMGLSKLSKSFNLLTTAANSSSGSDDDDRNNIVWEPVASCTGNWLSFLDWDDERFWTVSEDMPFHWQPDPDPLPSDSRFRADLAALAAGDVVEAQKAKEALENSQRVDAKLRKLVIPLLGRRNVV
jgi:hypothetical protein